MSDIVLVARAIVISMIVSLGEFLLSLFSLKLQIL